MEDNNISTKLESKKYPGPVASGLFFSLTAILLIYGYPLLAFKNNYLVSGLGEIVFVLLPTLIFLVAGKYDIKDSLKLNKTRPVNYVIVVFLMILGMPVVGVLNAIVLGAIRLIFGKNLPIPQLVIPDVPTLFVAILVIGVSAAVCEETLFRGLISKGYEKYGVIPSIVITSILFGILHRDIQKAVSTILLGALIWFIVYRTNSIYAGMVAHFTNNTSAVLLTYTSTKIAEKFGDIDVNKVQNFDFSSIPTVSLVIAIVFYFIVFVGFVAAFIGLMYTFYKSTAKDFQSRNIPNQISAEQEEDVSVLFAGKTAKLKSKSRKSIAVVASALPGILLIVFTFVGQFLQLMNIESGFLYNILKMLALI